MRILKLTETNRKVLRNLYHKYVVVWIEIILHTSEYKGREGDRLGKMASVDDWELSDQLKSEVWNWGQCW